MTIAVGFACQDGIVIAADRQVTGTGYTYQDCKLRAHRWKNGMAIWGFSGDVDTQKLIWQDIEKTFSRDAVIGKEEIQATLSQIVASHMRKKEEFYLIFGTFVDGKRALFIASKARVTFGDRCEVIGWGDSPLSRYLRGLFIRYGQMPTIRTAAVKAIDFIRQAKNYDGQYVGGDTDVYMLNSTDNTMLAIHPTYARELERDLELVEIHRESLLRDLLDPDGNQQSIAQSSAHLSKFTSVLQGKIKGLNGIILLC